MLAFSESDRCLIRRLDWASTSMKSRVACESSWRSVRFTPISTPCVKTLSLPTWPKAPVGANVTALDPGSSRQLFGTLTRNRSPSEYSRKRDEGGCTGPSVPLGRDVSPSSLQRLVVLDTSSDEGARGSDFR